MTDNLDELRESESSGNRLERDNPQAQPDFVDALVAALDEIEDGDRSDTFTAYDPKLAAVLEALESDARMDETFEQLRDSYDGDSGLDSPSRSAIIRLAVRVGFQEGTDEVLDDLRDAVERRETTTI